MLAVLLCLCIPGQSFSQIQEASLSNGLTIKPGARFEYFSRKVIWGDEESTSDLKASLITLHLEIEINRGFSISGMAGYALPNYDALTFRQLPFSVQLDTGDLGGFILGGEIKKSLFAVNDLEFGLSGQFLYHLGKEKTWDLPDLNVPGSVTGKPTWMRASAGFNCTFTGFQSFSPYLAVSYNKLWGQFKMQQAIQDLQGTEEKELRSKSVIDITLGGVLDIGDHFFLRGEAHLLPYGGGTDLGIVAIAGFSF